jgi:hypothetical protein
MAGPVAGVLMRPAVDRAELRAWLARAFDRDDGMWRLRDGRAIGLPWRPEPTGPFAVEPGQWELADTVDLPAVVGFKPRTAVGVSAMAKGAADHEVLGRLVHALARDFDGLVDFGQPLPVPVGSDARAVAAGLPGTVVEVPYRTVTGELWYTHVADPEFVAAWLAHPHFRMVK